MYRKLLFGIALTAIAAQTASAAMEFQHDKTVDEVFQMAKAQNKKVLIDFYGET